MPLSIPNLDDRTFQQLLEEALARIPSHNPEWTNFNASDPGVTILEVFAFLTETLLYRANQIPERNRKKFLSLLGVGLRPATAACGLAQVLNERGPTATVTLGPDLELRAGEVPFRTARGLDVLPIETRFFYKRLRSAVPEDVRRYYAELYASEADGGAGDVEFQAYETVPFADRGLDALDLGNPAVHGSSLWMAVLARPVDVGDLDGVRKLLAGRTLTVGVVPIVQESGARLPPGAQRDSERVRLDFQLPVVDVDRGPDGLAPPVYRRREKQALYAPQPATPAGETWREPGVIDVQLPTDPDQLAMWNDLEPLDAGVGDHPPDLEDSALRDRLVTWIKITPGGAARVALQWIGVNAVPVAQRVDVCDEPLPAGTGEPDQERTVARAPVLPGSLTLTVGGDLVPWRPIHDLFAAGPEIPVVDPRLPPGAVRPASKPEDSRVFELDAESGRIRFGDGIRGRRPPHNAAIRASYAYSHGRAGNLGIGAITKGVGLPPGFRVTNPIPTWGGVDTETVADGERRIVRELRHRDRAVSAEDFAELALRTPGADIGRVEVLPAWHPDLGTSEPGDAPGVVTLMIVPRHDATYPDTPVADTRLLDAVACWLHPRRLVTTEVVLRPADYQNLWISVGFELARGASAPVVREAVARALRQFLSPLPPRAGEPRVNAIQPGLELGWPLRRTLYRLELLAEVARVPGVALVRGLELAGPTGAEVEQVEFRALGMPRITALSVALGEPLSVAALRGAPAPAAGAPASARVVPVPAIPEEC